MAQPPIYKSGPRNDEGAVKSQKTCKSRFALKIAEWPQARWAGKAPQSKMAAKPETWEELSVRIGKQSDR